MCPGLALTEAETMAACSRLLKKVKGEGRFVGDGQFFDWRGAGV